LTGASGGPSLANGNWFASLAASAKALAAAMIAASPSVAEYRFKSMNADAKPLIGIPRVVAC
jgi:hypothetical protein